MDEDRAVVNRGHHPYPTDIKAEAVALVYESGNFSEAAREIARRHPDRPPSRQLITGWFKQTDPDAFAALCSERKEAFETGLLELAEKASARLYDALDEIPAGQVAIPAGIAMDKGLRLVEIEARHGHGGNVHNYGPVVIVTGATAPEREDDTAIEGESCPLPSEPSR